ncbi:glutamate-cysteine ligase family protein [Natrialbaceae archaeon AArc-T1-2]|uniref:glutamate-cysteine ligase family protein n=1 Tax=Natrialbaceae archaeon AArc-T1-2 TaxID=3053904 RepID=UPI00255ADE04|nr:glutamate-cysteine ligase family protein [Natrialbaceae archaeon AArc-T1-2]WIV67414.1 glutamate-cysteine ligase family protein [Natrialbaceae archaeon AArc-T1-2]
MQTSIEVEYWVVDESGELTEPGPLVDVSDNVEEEFVGPLFELKTPPCETMAELKREFVGELANVLAEADRCGKGLVPLGTPINCGPIDQHPGERSHIQECVLGENFGYAKYCAGTHVHVEKRNVVDQLNVLIALDPALALCNSSPYFEGRPIASSARAYVYRRKCYEQFPKHGQLWEYADNVGQWNRRLERRYEEFKDAAVTEGIDEERVDERFTPDDVVWTPVRLRQEFPTVEWRSPDATVPSEILRLVADLEAVMERLHHTNVSVAGENGAVTEDGIALPEFDAVCGLADEAIIDGLASQNVRNYLDRMGFSVADYEPITDRIAGREHVGPTDACELRRTYADLLARDVDALLQTADA